MQGIFVRKKNIAGKWVGAHVRESKMPAQGLHSIYVGIFAIHKEIGNMPRPGWRVPGLW